MCDGVVVGSVAEWATFGATFLATIAAGVAVVFSARANALAKRVYADDVKVRTEAQARAVYPEILGLSPYKKGDAIPAPPSDWSMSQVGGTNLLDVSKTATFAAERLSLLDVVLHNGSGEIIGPFQVSVRDLTLQLSLPGSIGAGIVRPGETTTLIRIAIPYTEHRIVPEIAFRDSVGQWWSRIYYEPVQKLDAKRQRAYEAVGI